MLPTRRVLVVTALAVAVAGCGSSAGPATTTSTTPSSPSGATSGAASTGAAATSAPTSATAAATADLAVTDAVRAQLVAAGAALNGVPAAEFVGLAPGRTFYAYDAASGTYWAGAQLVPGSSTQAQVSVQDDGAYVLFHRTSGGAWTAQDVGLAGVGGTPCPVAVPPAVLALWGWPAGTCRPANT
jgi:hypothetical protein